MPPPPLLLLPPPPTEAAPEDAVDSLSLPKKVWSWFGGGTVNGEFLSWPVLSMSQKSRHAIAAGVIGSRQPPSDELRFRSDRGGGRRDAMPCSRRRRDGEPPTLLGRDGLPRCRLERPGLGLPRNDRAERVDRIDRVDRGLPLFERAAVERVGLRYVGLERLSDRIGLDARFERCGLE